jgi:hypothetical protein
MEIQTASNWFPLRLLFTLPDYLPQKDFLIMNIESAQFVLSVLVQVLVLGLVGYLSLAFFGSFLPHKLATVTQKQKAIKSAPVPIALLPSAVITPIVPVCAVASPSDSSPQAKKPNNAELRTLCSKNGIKWRNAQPDRKHLTSAQMLKKLQEVGIL